MEGKTALITGGSRGIGAETVRLFTQAGARVAFSYRLARDRAEALAAECGGTRRCIAIEQDLATPTDGRALVDAAVKAFGRLDILVVNHGIWPPHDAPIATMRENQWRQTMGINLDSVFGLVQATVGQMEQQTASEAGARGHIVLISSTAGQRGEAYHADYGASKGAMIAFVKSLAPELAGRDITVNSVAPGWVDTEMCAIPYADGGRDRIAATIPLGRVADARDIAGPIVFLCSPLARHITGEILNVNGGSVLCG